MKYSLSKQTGHAALLFALMIPAFFAIFVLASDGARALQLKARLDDATEAAALAVAAQNYDGTNTEEQTPKVLTEQYVTQYMGSMTSGSQPTIKIETSEGSEDGVGHFFEYKITTSTTHDTFFPNAASALGNKFGVSSSATARKNESEAVDVMFVTDFSGSMLYDWAGNKTNIKEKQRYTMMIKVIQEISDDFAASKINQKNKIGNVSYDAVTQSARLSLFFPYCFNSQLIYDTKYVRPRVLLPGWYYWRTWPIWYVDGLRPWLEHSLITRYPWEVDYGKTVKDSENAKLDCIWSTSPENQFEDIDLTSDYKKFSNTIGGFKPAPDAATASYEGIMRGAQLLSKGKNPRRLLIILSDGIDSESNITWDLVKEGMCDNILEELKTNTKGDEFIPRLALIGFGSGYDVFQNTPLTKCVGGKENVFSAKSKKDIKDNIIALISEETGHIQ